MAKELDYPHDEVFELEYGLRDKLERCLVNVGHSEVEIKSSVVTRVDHYHNNCYYITLPNSREKTPQYIMKTLDPSRGWDVKEEMVRREHNIGIYASEKVEGLKPRQFAGWMSADENSPAMVLYSYLGEAATYIEDPDQTLEIMINLLPKIVDLHTATASSHFGKSLSEEERSRETYADGKGVEITRFLLNDIKRDGLDPTGEITSLIMKKWIPILNEEEIFALTHKDVTMSNIILEGNNPISLIDWTYSRWEDPAYDLSYLAFWCLKRGSGAEIFQKINELLPKYHLVGLYPEKTILFFLAFKCIEYGRFKGQQWVDLGRSLLEAEDQEVAIALIAGSNSENS